MSRGGGAASALFFRDTARQAVALLLWSDIVKRPRKGDFAFCLWSALLLCGSFCFLGSGAQQLQTRTQTKKRWGPALWLWKGLVALARAKLRKQQLKIRLHKEKKKRQSKHGTNKSRCKPQSNISQKPHAPKKRSPSKFK